MPCIDFHNLRTSLHNLKDFQGRSVVLSRYLERPIMVFLHILYLLMKLYKFFLLDTEN